jgi:hypothetical protein
MSESLRRADYGALMLEMFVLVVGILLALAVDRWNQDRIEGLETSRIVERLESDTARNLAMFERTLHDMERNLVNAKSLFRALDAGSMAGEDTARIDSAIVYIDVVPSYPLVFSGYEELIATGRLRRLDDPVLIDLLGNQRAEYEAAQAVVGYWRDLIRGATDALDQHVDFYYTSEEMNEGSMAARFSFATLAADRKLKNEVFDAVDIHSDWLGLQTSIYELTKQIDARLRDSDGSRSR